MMGKKAPLSSLFFDYDNKSTEMDIHSSRWGSTFLETGTLGDSVVSYHQ